MKLRSLLATLLALTLMMCLGGALADITVEEVYTLEARDVILNRVSNTMAIRGLDDDFYLICDEHGNPLSDTRYVRCNTQKGFYKVAVENSLNNLGLVDGQGNEVMPMIYGDVQYVSDKWQLGMVLTDATVDNYDYRSSGSGSDTYYLIDHIDVYFEGSKVGELSRLDYYYAEAHGDYLEVTTKERTYNHYDKYMNLNSSGEGLINEYNDDYRTKSIVHNGSGQQAFVPGCTLTADEVEEAIDYNNGEFLDLQGNVLRKVEAPYDIIYKYYGDYAMVRRDKKYGLVDKYGNEVLPCEYDEIKFYDKYFNYGYQMVVKDGKVGYVNLQGEVTCDFKYASSVIKKLGLSPLTYLIDLEGNIVMLSAAAGVLPETYTDVKLYDGCPVFAALNGQKQAALIDLYGNELIPFGNIYDSTSDFTISYDGSIVVGYQGYRMYEIYLLSDGEEAEEDDIASLLDFAYNMINAVERVPGGTSDQDEEPAAATQPAPAGSWNCSVCNTANTGKFCTECGTAKPAAAPKCSNCGYEPDGTPKFCPECGTKF